MTETEVRITECIQLRSYKLVREWTTFKPLISYSLDKTTVFRQTTFTTATVTGGGQRLNCGDMKLSSELSRPSGSVSETQGALRERTNAICTCIQNKPEVSVNAGRWHSRRWGAHQSAWRDVWRLVEVKSLYSEHVTQVCQLTSSHAHCVVCLLHNIYIYVTPASHDWSSTSEEQRAARV